MDDRASVTLSEHEAQQHPFLLPVSGTSMNPARSLRPALVSGDWSDFWLYVAGPLTGAIIAVGCAVILRGGGADPAARVAAPGGAGIFRVKEEGHER